MGNGERNQPGPENYVEMCDRLWNKACEFDGIDPQGTMFVFSNGNKYREKFNAVYDHCKYALAKRLIMEHKELMGV